MFLLLVGISRVLDGVLTAIEFLSSEGFLHRDIRPENIHVSADGEGLLADFGLCTHKEVAVLPWQIGAGTAEYQATEVATTGSSLCSELFAVSVCFLEMMLSRNPFDGKVCKAGRPGCGIVTHGCRNWNWLLAQPLRCRKEYLVHASHFIGECVQVESV